MLCRIDHQRMNLSIVAWSSARSPHYSVLIPMGDKLPRKAQLFPPHINKMTLPTLITLLSALLVVQLDAFTSSLGGLALHINTATPQYKPALFNAASSDNNEAEGGTEWIKDAMGTDKSPPPPSPPPVTPAALEFTADEIQDMEKLIMDLSKEQNDDLRRQKLADIFDKELVAATAAAAAAAADASDIITTTDSSSGEVILPQEIPRFAQLFQYSLDIIGENVQNAAREKAMILTENSLHVIEDSSGSGNGEVIPSTGSERVKSEEELQLWALIDMMVQSKTRVKLYMGSLGSKGAFR